MNCKISWYCPKNSERRKIIKIAALTKYLSRKPVIFNTHMTVPHLSFYFRPALCAYELKRYYPQYHLIPPPMSDQFTSQDCAEHVGKIDKKEILRLVRSLGEH